MFYVAKSNWCGGIANWEKQRLNYASWKFIEVIFEAIPQMCLSSFYMWMQYSTVGMQGIQMMPLISNIFSDVMILIGIYNGIKAVCKLGIQKIITPDPMKLVSGI